MKLWPIIIFFVFVACGKTQKPSSHSQVAQTARSESLMFLQTESDDVSFELSRAISDVELQQIDHLVFVVASERVDLIVDTNPEDLQLINSRNISAKRPRSPSSQSSSPRSRSDSSTVPTVGTSSRTSSSRSDDLSKQPSSVSKIFEKKEIGSQKKIAESIPKDRILQKDRVVYQGVYIDAGPLRERLLRGMEVPEFTLDGQAAYRGQHVYSTASLRVTTAVAQAGAAKQQSVLQGPRSQMVFKMKVKASQGVIRESSTTKRDPKLVDVYGRVSPDQILGYYHVRNVDIVGDFKENPFQSRTQRAVTKIGDKLNKFLDHVRELVVDDKPSTSPRRALRYDPIIPGTARTIGSLKHVEP